MEKDFDQMNYYEMLDIRPDASALEIRSAYNAALQMYQPDSLVSYSFFSREERNKILSLLEKAYLTLINEAQKAKYDNELNPQGISPDAEKGAAVKKPVNIFDINRQGFSSPARKNHSVELKIKISRSQNIPEILSRQEIRGADLRTIRNELGVAIETIHQETKIRLDYLNYLEEDKTEKLPAAVFIKGFVRAYLKSLCIEPADEISARYMNGLAHKN
ncbi:MAG: helix-turn-helix domain-containing protein [Deltaproteobacteria bacterium]|nr:helix-turn-helix domain-containing protein [Deltaproteobacteria bacterium]